MVTILIPESLVREIEELRSAGLIASADEFAEQAIREKLSAARREQLVQETRAMQQDLAANGLTPEMLTQEFERFRHAAHAHR